MIRLALIIVSLVLLALMALNVALEIDVIGRHPFEWLAGALGFYVAASLPWPPTKGTTP